MVSKASNPTYRESDPSETYRRRSRKSALRFKVGALEKSRPLTQP